MTRTHITYETAKRLKEFCPELPEPMGEDGFKLRWSKYKDRKPNLVIFKLDEEEQCWAYQLHDILSKPFCEVLGKGKKINDKKNFGTKRAEIADLLMREYFHGGLPAVEAELIRMMEGK